MGYFQVCFDHLCAPREYPFTELLSYRNVRSIETLAFFGRLILVPKILFDRLDGYPGSKKIAP